MKDLTDRQVEILNFIKSFVDDNSYPPTVREVASHFGISPKASFDHISALTKKGFITQVKNKARTMKVTDKWQSLTWRDDLVYFE